MAARSTANAAIAINRTMKMETLAVVDIALPAAAAPDAAAYDPTRGGR